MRDSGIYLMNADGSGVVQLTARGTEPAWSPDGRRIAFVMGQQIAIVNIDGSGFALLSAGPGDFSPAWSTDGSRIAFVGNRDPDNIPSSIYVMNVDVPFVAAEWTFLPSGARCASSSPAWSPDGQKLLLWSFCPEAVYSPPPPPDLAGFALVRSDGTGGMSPLPLPSNFLETYYSKPAWSPDGGFIAFSAPGFRGAGGDTLYIIRPTSPKAIRLGLGTRPAWRPAR